MWGQGWTWAMICCGLLLVVIVFIIFAVYYGRYRAAIRSRPAGGEALQEQKRIHHIVIAIFSFLVFVAVSALVLFLAVLGLRKVEQKNLFCPTKLDRYRKLTGVVHSLPSGALVLNLTPNAPANARRVLFLPGNTGSLEHYHEAFAAIASYGYNLFALE